MDIILLLWRLVGGILGVLLGIQFIILILTNRKYSIQAGLDYPREQIWTPWMYRRTAVIVVVMFATGIFFSFESTFAGVLVAWSLEYWPGTDGNSKPLETPRNSKENTKGTRPSRTCSRRPISF
jgi:hypothetical protein